ncbi:MAG: TIGR03545 family protein [Bacteroidota bacterium]
MRVKGIIFIVVLGALIGAGYFFITDSWLEKQIEYQASVANTAKVEIDNLNTDLFALKFRFDRMQVTDPSNTMRNMFELGETELDIAFWPLFWKKVIIEDVVATGFALDTERATDGYFEMPEEDDDDDDTPEEPGFISEAITDVKGQVAGNAQAQFNDIKSDINTDSLLAELDLQAISNMDSLKNGLEQNYTKWENTLTDNPVEARIASIQKTVTTINVNEIKDPKKAVEQLKTVQTLTKELDSLKRTSSQLKRDFEADLAASRKSVGQIDEWVQQDINSAVDMAKLPTLDVQSLAANLFSGTLLQNFETYLGYIQKARDYGSRFSDGEEEEEIERYEGKNYAFSDKYNWPGFWIKNVELSGRTLTDIDLQGTVTNITSEQEKTGVPTLIDMSGVNAEETSLSLTGELNYLMEEPKEEFVASYSNFPLENTRISPSELLPYDLKEGTGAINSTLALVGKRIDTEIEYVANQIEFDFEKAGEPKSRTESIIRTAISGTDEITASALIDNVDGPLKVKIRSNVDQLFLDALNQTIKQEVEKAKQQIRDEVESRVTAKREEVEAFREEQEARLTQKSEELQQKITEQTDQVTAKKNELEKKKKQLEDEAKNKVKDAVRKKIGF